ncbi:MULTISPECIES: DUF1565 domain-containing protein [unclassified Coleofasciculus]|uniref:DUF1565 domain-containing protein n=1 Tax=unclassified Coleofasciculus TaxID=2692782 RepID=UPI00187FA612|nr:MULTISPECIES: DUF1565 domain-containing protein [unclassified Coleofasciculus]MBE9127831.1 DUF1565 domain-containing protein [Coleofasciculus sp. LEGE 07081]MBE9149416.1 DUF1565 domain-containing protein [Coleofasciculus sp. LEGE 07092]
MMHPPKMRLLWGIQWLRHPLHFRQEKWAIAAVSVGLIAFATLGLRVPTAVAQLTRVQSFSIAQNELDINLLFVNPATGDDNKGNGKADSPFKTIARALQLAQPNTVILLAPGIYSAETGESFPLILKPGVTIQGNSRTRGQTIEIRGGGTFESSTAKSETITILGADQATLTGVTITNPNPAGYGLWIESSSPVVVDNTFTGNSNAGIVIKGNSAPTIRSNYFYNNGGKGIIADGTLQADVRENVFEGTENAALQLISDRQTRLPSTKPSTNLSNEADNTPIASGNYPRTEPDSNLTGEGANGESNPQIPFPAAEIKQPERQLQNVPLNGIENNLSTSGVDSTTTGEANNPSDSAPAASTTTVNSQPDNSTPPDSVASSSTQNEVAESSLANSITAASFPVPSSLKPKPSTSRVEVSSTPATSNSTNEQAIPQHPVINESTASPPMAAIPPQKPSFNSAQIPMVQATPQSESVEIPVPQPESAAIPPASEQTSEESGVIASSQPNSVENSVPVLNSTNPLADSGAGQIAAVGEQRYRVLVEVKSDSQQELVRSLVPGAFRTSLDGQTLMQAGLFSTRENAEKILQLLDSKGLNATIEPLN